MSKPPAVKSRIPEFRSVQEEAEFWDTHSLADFEDEFEPVEVEVARPLRHVLVVRLEHELFDRIAVVAKRRGVGPAALARSWVLGALGDAENQDLAEPGPSEHRLLSR